MRSIYRYTLLADSEWHLFPSVGGHVHVSVDRDGLLDRVELWVEVGDGPEMTDTWFRIYNTGLFMPLGDGVDWVASMVPPPFVPTSVCHVLRSTVDPVDLP